MWLRISAVLTLVLSHCASRVPPRHEAATRSASAETEAAAASRVDSLKMTVQVLARTDRIPGIRTLLPDAKLGSQDRFVFFISVSKPAYVYVIDKSQEGRSVQLHPLARRSSAEPQGAAAWLRVPGGSAALAADPGCRTQEFALLASTHPLTRAECNRFSLGCHDESDGFLSRGDGDGEPPAAAAGDGGGGGKKKESDKKESDKKESDKKGSAQKDEGSKKLPQSGQQVQAARVGHEDDDRLPSIREVLDPRGKLDVFSDADGVAYLPLKYSCAE